MSSDQRVPRGASKKGQGSKRPWASGGSPSAGEWEALALSLSGDENIKGEETDSTKASYGLHEQAKTDRYVQDTSIRRYLAMWACIVVSAWLLTVAIFLCLQQSAGENGLSDVVLVALLSTTTLNVLGISFIVLNGYFKSHRSSGTSGD